jgi:hypothetical protein
MAKQRQMPDLQALRDQRNKKLPKMGVFRKFCLYIKGWLPYHEVANQG